MEIDRGERNRRLVVICKNFAANPPIDGGQCCQRAGAVGRDHKVLDRA